MIKISNKEIIDIVRYNEEKVIFVEKNPLDVVGKFKVKYFILNLSNGDKEVITKSAYLLKKFGSSYDVITKKLIDFVQCDCAIFPSKNVFVNYPNGQTALFNPFGEMKWNGTLNYNGSACSTCAIDGDYFWSCCRDENCVIRYSADSINVDIRIGSKESNTFNKPIFASADEKGVYICCEDGRVRMINKSTLDVIDIASNVPDLKKFYKFGKFSIICASSGAYIEKD